MARHRDPDDRSFRRSLARAALRALGALLLTAALVAVLSQIGTR
jgi:hypothetical protein